VPISASSSLSLLDATGNFANGTSLSLSELELDDESVGEIWRLRLALLAWAALALPVLVPVLVLAVSPVEQELVPVAVLPYYLYHSLYR